MTQISTSPVPKNHIVMFHNSSCYDPNINFSCPKKSDCYVPSSEALSKTILMGHERLYCHALVVRSFFILTNTSYQLPVFYYVILYFLILSSSFFWQIHLIFIVLYIFFDLTFFTFQATKISPSWHCVNCVYKIRYHLPCHINITFLVLFISSSLIYKL